MGKINFGVPTQKRLYSTPHDFINLAHIPTYINAQFVDTPILEAAVPNMNPLDDTDYDSDDVYTALEWQESGVFKYDDKPAMFTLAAPLTENEEVNVRITTATMVDVYYKGSSIHVPSIFDNITIYENLRDYLTEVAVVYPSLSDDQRRLVDRFAEFMILIAKYGIAQVMNEAEEREQDRVLGFHPKFALLVNDHAHIGMLRYASMDVSQRRKQTKWESIFTLPEPFINARRSIDAHNRPKEDDPYSMIGSLWGG